MPSEIQQNRYDQLIRRVAGIVGPGSKVAEALTELFPIIDVEGDRGELQILSGTSIAFGGGNLPGVVAQAPGALLFNPADSGNIVTVTTMIASGTPANFIRWGPTLTPFGAAVGSETFRDLRRPLTDRPVAQISQENKVAFVGGTCITLTATEEPFILSDPNGVIVLAPGTGLEVGLGLLNSQFAYTFYWRERPFEQSETNF